MNLDFKGLGRQMLEFGAPGRSYLPKLATAKEQQVVPEACSQNLQFGFQVAPNGNILRDTNESFNFCIQLAFTL